MKQVMQISLTLTAVVVATLLTFIALAIVHAQTAFAHSGLHHSNHSDSVITPEVMSQRVSASVLPAFDERLLQPVLETLNTKQANNQLTAEERLVYARLLQHEHHFSLAFEQLEFVLQSDPKNNNALLLKANIELNQGSPGEAVKTCSKLLAQAHPLVVSTCLLEARMQQSPASEYYEQLSEIAQRFPPDSETVAVWVNEVLGEMAFYAESPREAIEHIEQNSADNRPVSSWVVWSKAKLKLQKARDILYELGPLVNASPVPNDSMLLYLALAEQQLGNGQYWTGKMAQRVFIREHKEDTTHAAEVALYYLYLAGQPERAMHWATLNWENAKSMNDKHLLAIVRQHLNTIDPG